MNKSSFAASRRAAACAMLALPMAMPASAADFSLPLPGALRQGASLVQGALGGGAPAPASGLHAPETSVAKGTSAQAGSPTKPAAMDARTEVGILAMADEAVEYLRRNGQAALIQAVNQRSPHFARGTYYVVVRKADGTTLAHPDGHKYVGKSIAGAVDAEGKHYGQDIIARARSGERGWVEYRAPNPRMNRSEPMAAYVIGESGLIIELDVIAL